MGARIFAKEIRRPICRASLYLVECLALPPLHESTLLTRFLDGPVEHPNGRPKAVVPLTRSWYEAFRSMTLVEKPGAAPTLCLDEVLNLSAARPLAEALASTRGSDLDISAANVRHVGAQCGQVLLAGLNAWRADGHTLRILDISAGFNESVNLLGLDSFFPDEETSQ